MKELIWVRVQYASRQQCCKTHKRPLRFTFTQVFMKSTRYSCQIVMKLVDRFSKNTRISHFTKIRPVGAELFHADGRTDITKLVVTFRNFAKSPKLIKYYVKTNHTLLQILSLRIEIFPNFSQHSYQHVLSALIQAVMFVFPISFGVHQPSEGCYRLDSFVL